MVTNCSNRFVVSLPGTSHVFWIGFVVCVLLEATCELTGLLLSLVIFVSSEMTGASSKFAFALFCGDIGTGFSGTGVLTTVISSDTVLS